MAKKEEDKKVKGVPIERQREASKLRSEISAVIHYIAEELVKIWELWGENHFDQYYYNIHATGDYGISFMEGGCRGDPPSNPDYLFSDKGQWIEDYVSLSEGNIADPEAFLSKHRLYKEEYDECCCKSGEENVRREKEKRRSEYARLKREFGDDEG